MDALSVCYLYCLPCRPVAKHGSCVLCFSRTPFVSLRACALTADVHIQTKQGPCTFRVSACVRSDCRCTQSRDRTQTSSQLRSLIIAGPKVKNFHLSLYPSDLRHSPPRSLPFSPVLAAPSRTARRPSPPLPAALVSALGRPAVPCGAPCRGCAPPRGTAARRRPAPVSLPSAGLEGLAAGAGRVTARALGGMRTTGGGSRA